MTGAVQVGAGVGEMGEAGPTGERHVQEKRQARHAAVRGEEARVGFTPGSQPASLCVCG